MDASEILQLSPDILRCAVLDDAGRILSYADSDKGKIANLPVDYPVTIKALVIEGLSEALPKELGNIRFTSVVTDKYRLITLALCGRTVMLAMPLTVSPDPICDAAIRKFGTAPLRR